MELRVDWTCADAYGDRVVVELDSRTIHTSATPVEATRWARKWMEDRGLEWTCDIDTHQRRMDKYIILSAALNVRSS